MPRHRYVCAAFVVHPRFEIQPNSRSKQSSCDGQSRLQPQQGVKCPVLVQQIADVNTLAGKIFGAWLIFFQLGQGKDSLGIGGGCDCVDELR